MNSFDARRILLTCRPGTDDMRDPAVVAALEQARRDPELQAWWEQQQVFQQRARESFRSIRVPSHLQDRILVRQKIIEVAWWRRPTALSAAAAIALLVTVSVFWRRPPPESTFPIFRSRMVDNVQRQYAMTIKTNDIVAISNHLAAANAPADYVLPEKLGQLPAMGAGVLSWQDRRVAMVCLNAGPQGTLFVFVVNTASVKRSPAQREFALVNSLMTVGWTEDGKTYVLAGNGSEEWLRTLTATPGQ